MKILYLISGIGPSNGSGTEYIQSLIFKLSGLGIDATIISPIYRNTPKNCKSWARSQEKKYHLKIILINSPKLITDNIYLHFLLTPFITSLVMFRLLRKEKFDIVHEYSSTPIILLRSLLVKIFFNIPTVFSLSVFNISLLGSLSWIKIFDFASIYLIQSRKMTAKLSKLGINEDKIVYCSPGIDTRKFKTRYTMSIARNTLSLPKNKYIVTYFGPLTREKGIEEIINAAKVLEYTYSDISINIFTIDKGSKEEARYYNFIMKLNSPNISVLRSPVNIPLLARASNIIILPQRSGHGTTIPPISLLETLYSGTPVITTDILDNKEIVGDNGTIIKPGNSVALSRAILNRYQNKTATTVRPSKHIANYDSEVMANTIVKTYKRVLKIHE